MARSWSSKNCSFVPFQSAANVRFQKAWSASCIRGLRLTSNIRFVPRLPVPRVHLFEAISLHRVLCPLVHQLLPFLVVRWYVAPSSINTVWPSGWVKLEKVWLWVGRERKRHEPYLHVWSDVASKICIKYPVDNGKVVNRTAVNVFGVCVCASPFQPRHTDQVLGAVASRQEVVSPEVNLLLAECPKLLDEC